MLPTWAANGYAERTANRVTPATSEPCPPCGSQELLWLASTKHHDRFNSEPFGVSTEMAIDQVFFGGPSVS